MEGYIFKFVNFFEGWKPRYAIIRDYKLEMGFKKDEPAKKVYSLINLKVISKDKCEFILDFGSKIKLELRTYTEIERNGWVNYIKDKQLQYALESRLLQSSTDKRRKSSTFNDNYSQFGFDSDFQNPDKGSLSIFENQFQDSVQVICKNILTLNGTLSLFHEYIYNGRSDDTDLLRIYEQLIVLRLNLQNSMEDLITTIPRDILEKEKKKSEREMDEKPRESMLPLIKKSSHDEEKRISLSPAKKVNKIYTPVKLSRLSSSNLLRTEILNRIFEYVIKQPFELNSVSYYPRTSLEVCLKYRDDLTNVLVSNISDQDPFCYYVPLSSLQREIEPFQYFGLLDMAEQQNSSTRKMAYICAFVIAEASINLNRILDPIEANIGETYQFEDKKLGFRAFLEQVSHTEKALMIESENLFLFGNINQIRTFSILKGAIETKYSSQRNLLFIDRKLSKIKNHYLLKRPNLIIKNLIFGSPQADLIGILEIKEFINQDCRAELKFIEGNSKQQSYVEGKIFNSNGEVEFQIKGSWKDKIDLWDANGTNQILNLWRIGIDHKSSASKKDGSYSITEYGCNLNYFPKEVNNSILASDSRFNMKVKCLERNDIEEYRRLSKESMIRSSEVCFPKYFNSDDNDSGLPLLYFPVIDFYRSKAFD